MSSLETGQMSAVKTGRMSAVETGQMSSVARTDIRLVSIHNVEVSAVSISQCSSLRSLNCGNVTMSKSQKSQLWQCHDVQVSENRSGPRSAKMLRNGSRMVARPQESTQMNPTVVPKRLGPVPRPQTHQKWPETPKSACPGGGSRV